MIPSTSSSAQLRRIQSLGRSEAAGLLSLTNAFVRPVMSFGQTPIPGPEMQTSLLSLQPTAVIPTTRVRIVARYVLAIPHQPRALLPYWDPRSVAVVCCLCGLDFFGQILLIDAGSTVQVAGFLDRRTCHLSIARRGGGMQSGTTRDGVSRTILAGGCACGLLLREMRDVLRAACPLRQRLPVLLSGARKCG